MEPLKPRERIRAGEAVRREMEAQGLSLNELCRRAGVAPVTVRDLASGKRWPWTPNRNRIERALGWQPGRITEIARGQDDGAPIGERAPKEPETLEQALAEVLERCSGLSLSQRYEVIAYAVGKVEENEERRHQQQRRASPENTRAR